MSTDMLMLPMPPVCIFSAVAEASDLSSAGWDKGDSGPGQASGTAAVLSEALPCPWSGHSRLRPTVRKHLNNFLLRIGGAGDSGLLSSGKSYCLLFPLSRFTSPTHSTAEKDRHQQGDCLAVDRYFQCNLANFTEHSLSIGWGTRGQEDPVSASEASPCLSLHQAGRLSRRRLPAQRLLLHLSLGIRAWGRPLRSSPLPTH